MGPGGELITNDGELSVILDAESTGAAKPLRTKMTFQAAKVRKPLLAVSSVIERGNLTIFDGVGSYIVTGSAEELKPIRDAVKAVKMKVPLREKNGVYVMNVRQPKTQQQQQQQQQQPKKSMDVDCDMGFIRQEAA